MQCPNLFDNSHWHLTLNMAASYSIKCINTTENSYYFGAYLTFPNTPSLKSVVWKIRGVPPKGHIPSTADINWTLTYAVYIGQRCHDEYGTVCTGEQMVIAEVGKTYQVVYSNGDIPEIDRTPTGSCSVGLIHFKNNTNRPLDMGFAISESVISLQNVAGGEAIEFDIHPTYCVACYHNIQLGQVVDSGVELGPVTVKYEEGYTKCKVEAAVQNGKHILRDPVYD